MRKVIDIHFLEFFQRLTENTAIASIVKEAEMQEQY